jgi:hypothetical protein
MSDAYDSFDKAINVWSKLYTYLKFRQMCNGMWISCYPELWYDIITDSYNLIETSINWDSGGGPLSNHYVKAKRGDYDTAEILYEIAMTYEDPECLGDGFFKVADSACRYMKSYMHSKSDSLMSKAIYFSRSYEKDSKLKADKWCKLFGITDDVGELPVIGNDLYGDIHIKEIPENGFKFLSISTAFTQGHVEPLKDLAKEVTLAKQWALVALLEMQRYHCTSC